jgi:hypothetical protein
MGIAILIAATALLGSHGASQAQTVVPPPAEARQALDAAYLLGSWVPKESGNRCGTDGTMTFRKDGTWTAVGDEGTFELSGNRIRFEVTRLAEGSTPGPNLHEVTIDGPDQYRALIDGRITLTMVRCP